MNHFFIKPENIRDDKIKITGSDVNHIKNVLRIRTGESLLLSDGKSNDYFCSVESVNDNEIICSILSSEVSGTEPSVKFYLFQGLPKADKMEHIIQKSVELGVFKIIPVQTARSIVKYDEKKSNNKKERWQKIAESAAKQSRRGIIPEVEMITGFKDAVKKAAERPKNAAMKVESSA